MIDLTDCALLTNTFGGSEKKRRLIYQGRVYMVKLPDRVRAQKNPLSYMNNQFSEDIGCKIYKLLGYETQNTFLATYRIGDEEKIVVACEDFTQDGSRLIEFHKLSLEHLESDSLRTQANIDNVLAVIQSARRIADKGDFTLRFWEMFIIDGFIGNRDRNLDNWGALEEQDGQLHFAPIYDCGSSLSPLFTEEDMQLRLNDANLFHRDEFNIYSCYRENHSRILFSAYMKCPPHGLSQAILTVVPKVITAMPQIEQLIDGTPILSDIHKRYLKESLHLRLRHILRPALDNLPGGKGLHALRAANRITAQNGIADMSLDDINTEIAATRK